MAKNNTKKNVKKAKKAAKVAKKHPKLVAVVIVLVIIILIAAVAVYFVKPEIYDRLLGNNTTQTGGTSGGSSGNDGTSGGSNGAVSSGSLSDIESADLSIHFLELGNKSNGDCVLIKSGNTEVLIDAGSAKDSATSLKSYIDNYCTDGILEYVITTHSDSDHISAYVGSKSGSTYTGLLYQYQIGTIIKFANVKSATTLYNDYMTAVNYAATTYGTKVYTAAQCYDMTDGAQRQYFLDDNQTISINILYNYYYYNVDTSDNNNHSVVTLLTQKTDSGRQDFLFTGDLEEDGESKLVDYYANVPEGYVSEYNVLPKVVLYKAGHHGSKTSTTAKLMAAIQPENVAICCCAGAPEYTTTDANTFPTQIMLNNVAKYTDKIYVTSLATGLPDLTDGTFSSKSYSGYTSMNGTIVFYSVGGELKLYCSNNDTILKDTEWFAAHRTWNA
jgi:competence protein ComEC